MIHPFLPIAAALAAVPVSLASSEDVQVHRSPEGEEIRLADGTVVHRTQNPITDLAGITADGRTVLAIRWTETENSVGPVTKYVVRESGDQTFSRVRDDRPTIHLQAGIFDPKVSSAPEPMAGLETSGNQYIVQFHAQSLEAFRSALAARGAVVRHFLPNNAHLVQMDPATAAAVESLPFVRWVGAYHASYRLEAELLGGLAAGTIENGVKVYVQVLERGPAMKGEVASRLEGLGAHVEPLIPDGFRLEATLTADQLRAAASWDDVLWIDRWSPPETDMDKVRIDGGANYVESVGGFFGTGVRAEVCDTGLLTNHVDLQVHPTILHGANGTSLSHGTSTTGIVFATGAGAAARRGMLPDGQPIFADTSFPQGRYQHTAELLQAPYFAVFQTNSWGGGLTSSYTSTSMEMDDILFLNDIVITQSQSNAGSTSSRPQAWAKNIVSVGGIRHFDTQTLNDDAWGGGGSIGPAQDGRIKPDLSYWYDSILTLSSNGGSTSSFGGTSAATPMTAGHFGLFFQMWHAGIFGNTPGATVFDSRPKATTARAMMINTADRYNFSGANHDLTRTHQGWGRADVEEIFDSTNKFFIVNEEEVLGNLESIAYPITVDAGEPELAVTLVYLDLAGTTSAALHRINDVSLRVTSPGGTTTYWGNNGLTVGNVSTSGGSSNTRDVVENVFITNPEAGVWTVEVLADEIVQDQHTETPELDVDFALVVRGTTGTGGTPCLAPVVYCAAQGNSFTPGGATVLTLGSTSIATNDLQFLVSGAVPGQFGLFFYGTAQQNTPGGNGTLCVGGSQYRLNVASADPFGSVFYPIDNTAPPQPAGQISVGSTWNFQYWYRDPAAGGANYNFSEAVAVTFCE